MDVLLKDLLFHQLGFGWFHQQNQLTTCHNIPKKKKKHLGCARFRINMVILLPTPELIQPTIGGFPNAPLDFQRDIYLDLVTWAKYNSMIAGYGGLPIVPPSDHKIDIKSHNWSGSPDIGNANRMIQMSSFPVSQGFSHVHHVITLLGCMFVELRHLKCHKKILASSAILFQYVMLEAYTEDFVLRRNTVDWNGGWGVWNSRLKDSSQVICPSFQGTFLCPKSIRRTTNQLPAQKKKSCPRLTQLQHKI